MASSAEEEPGGSPIHGRADAQAARTRIDGADRYALPGRPVPRS